MKSSRPAPGKWAVFLTVAVGVFMSTLDGSIVNVALPTIMNDLGASLSTVEWVMMSYLLTVSSLLMSFGRLSDIQGRKRVYIQGLVAFSFGSLFCGLATGAAWLIAARAFQGVGAAMIMSCTQAIIVDAFPASERGKSLGMLGAVVASGLTCGPALGGWILHVANWQTIFYVNIPIGLITATAAARLLKNDVPDQDSNRLFDRNGAILLGLCMVSFLLVFTHAWQWGYTSPEVLCLTAACIFSGLGLIRDEVCNPAPILAPSLLRIRLFTLPVLSAMILFASLFSLVFLMPFFLMHPFGLSSRDTGYMMVTPFVFLFIFAPVAGILSDRIGSRLLCTAGMAIVSAAFFCLAGLMPDMEKLSVMWRLALAGTGIAIFTAPNNAAVMSAVPRQYMGIAAGTVATVRNLGMVMGIAMSGTIFNTVFYSLSGGQTLKGYKPEMMPVFMAAFRYAMTAAGIVAGFGVMITFLRGPEKKHGTQ